MAAGQALAATLVEVMAVAAREVEVVPGEMMAVAVLAAGAVLVEVMEVEMDLAEVVGIARK